MNAFNYLPDNDESANLNKEQINKQEEVKPEETVAEEKSAKKELNITLPKTDYELMMEEITPPPGLKQDIPLPPALNEANAVEEIQPAESNIQPKQETSDDFLAKAKSLTKEKQYAQALKEYQKAAEMTHNTDIVAECYDGIANVYAINKRYGSALSFAIKAYNMSPSTKREMTLARLYYKSGDIEKATKRINNILQRDFADDK